MHRSARVNRVVEVLKKLYPLELADNTWDNTGLLVDASIEGGEQHSPSVLLTIDLTASVAAEAIEKKVELVVAYHPFIFRGLKSISSKDAQQNSLLQLIRNGISVYSPHTAVDAAVGGVNDWLLDGIAHGSASRRVCQKCSVQVIGHEQAGYGREANIDPTPLSQLIDRIKNHLGLNKVQLIASPRHADGELIRSIAVCAGSGASVLRETKADLLVTGELGHHEMLHIKENGRSAIVCGHSNTERGFLPIFAKRLKKELPDAHISIATTDVDPIEYV